MGKWCLGVVLSRNQYRSATVFVANGGTQDSFVTAAKPCDAEENELVLIKLGWGRNIEEMRTLSNDEINGIWSVCTSARDSFPSEADPSIRDAFICLAELHKRAERTLKDTFTIEAPGFYNVYEKTLTLHIEQSNLIRSILAESVECWREGSIMMMTHEKVQQLGGNIFFRMKIVSIEGNIVTLTPQDSDNMAAALGKFMDEIMASRPKDEKTPPNTKFKVGPLKNEVTGHMQKLIKSGFERFRHSQMFNMWRGAYASHSICQSGDGANHSAELIHIGEYTLDVEQSRIANAAGQGYIAVDSPPGSGKTVTIAAAVQEIQKKCPHDRIVIVSPNNSAVSHAMETIHETMPYMRIAQIVATNSAEKITEGAQKNSLVEIALKNTDIGEDECIMIGRQRYYDAKDIIQYNTEMKYASKFARQATVVERYLLRDALEVYKPAVLAMTSGMLMCTRFDSDYGETASNRERFMIDHLIIEAASALSAPAMLAILCKFPHIKSVMIVGDSRQLAPFCNVNLKTPIMSDLNQGELNRFILSNGPVFRLRKLYRFNYHITSTVLHSLYPNVTPGVDQSSHTLANSLGFLPRNGFPVQFVNVVGESTTKNVNEAEAIVACNIVKFLLDRHVNVRDITIVAYHRSQQIHVRNKLRGLRCTVNVTTVDSYQNNENEVVILLTTKSTKAKNYNWFKFLGFLMDPRRTLAALTRAKSFLFVVGNMSHLFRLPIWSRLIETVRRKKLLVDEKGNVCKLYEYKKLRFYTIYNDAQVFPPPRPTWRVGLKNSNPISLPIARFDPVLNVQLGMVVARDIADASPQLEHHMENIGHFLNVYNSKNTTQLLFPVEGVVIAGFYALITGEADFYKDRVINEWMSRGMAVDSDMVASVITTLNRPKVTCSMRGENTDSKEEESFKAMELLLARPEFSDLTTQAYEGLKSAYDHLPCMEQYPAENVAIAVIYRSMLDNRQTETKTMIARIADIQKHNGVLAEDVVTNGMVIRIYRSFFADEDVYVEG